MIHKKLLSLLVLLTTAASGAWADNDALILTIRASQNSSFANGTKTFENKVIITLEGEVMNDRGQWMVDLVHGDEGSEGSINVEGINNTNITKIVFDGYTVEQSSAKLYFYADGSTPTVCTSSGGKGDINEMRGISVIEIYGPVVAVSGVMLNPSTAQTISDNLVDGRVYVLEPGHDYTVSYENNVEVGTATVVVKAGTSGNYRGEVKATFSIVGTTAILAVGGSPAGTTAQRYTLGGRQASATKKVVVK